MISTLRTNDQPSSTLSATIDRPRRASGIPASTPGDHTARNGMHITKMYGHGCGCMNTSNVMTLVERTSYYRTPLPY